MEASQGCWALPSTCLLGRMSQTKQTWMTGRDFMVWYGRALHFLSNMVSYVWPGEKKGRENTEEWEYETMNHMHRGEFKTGSSFAWEVRTNIAPSYSGGSTPETSLIENTRHQKLPHPPTYANGFSKSPGKPHFCLVAPILGQKALARFMILDCSDVLPTCKTHTSKTYIALLVHLTAQLLAIPCTSDFHLFSI